GAASRARFKAAHGQAQGRDPGELEARRRRHHPSRGVRRRGEKEISRRMEGAQAVPTRRATAQIGTASFRIRGLRKAQSVILSVLAKDLASNVQARSFADYRSG